MHIPRPFLFAADMDGTLLPNTTAAPPAGCLKRTQHMLQCLIDTGCPICYISGRHLSLARQGQKAFQLPEPTFWACNVGSEIYNRGGLEEPGWSDLLGTPFDHTAMWSRIRDIDGLQPQESEKQGRYKFSLYGRDGVPAADVLQAIRAGIEETRPDLKLVTSFEERTGRGLIDILPTGSGKAAALRFLANRSGFDDASTFFAGDSGNDADALLSGICATLVGNAPDEVRNRLEQQHRQRPESRIYFSRQLYGDGVVEGLRHYQLIDQQE